MKMTSTTPYNFLERVLVLTVHKGFWASKECEVFPHRLYTRIFYGKSQNLVNSLFLLLRSIVFVLIHRPKIIFFGSAHRLVPWFIEAKKYGLLRNIKLVATNYHSFSDAQAQYLDKIIIFSLSQMKQHAPALESKHEFVYLPTDGNFSELQPSRLGNYIFSGGGHSRDYASLIEAVRGLDVHLKIVTFSYKTLGYTRELPENCEVLWTMPLQEFLGIMADALLVVVPLEEGIGPRGHTTAAQALRLGKAVITTENASMEEYITHEQEGLLVRAGDVSGYRQAITRLLEDPQLLARCECNARKRIPGLTYAAFRQHIVVLCLRLLLEDRLVHGCTHNS